MIVKLKNNTMAKTKKVTNTKCFALFAVLHECIFSVKLSLFTQSVTSCSIYAQSEDTIVERLCRFSLLLFRLKIFCNRNFLATHDGY